VRENERNMMALIAKAPYTIVEILRTGVVPDDCSIQLDERCSLGPAPGPLCHSWRACLTDNLKTFFPNHEETP
jgi:hypothetical protein